MLDDDYEITGDKSRIDFETVHNWLTNSYWSPGVGMDIVRRAAENSSMVVSIFHKKTDSQVGYARVISDKATFGYLADVYIDEAHRGNGLGQAIVKFALEHPEYQGFRRWVLATMDAHGVYEKLGFTPLAYPDRWMVFLPAKP